MALVVGGEDLVTTAPPPEPGGWEPGLLAAAVVPTVYVGKARH